MTYLEHAYKVVSRGLDVCSSCDEEVLELCADSDENVCVNCCECNHVQDDVIVDHRHITFDQ